jgi:hypothetical protein
MEGRRRPYRDLPKSIDKLMDDPFRSLAGELRRAGGFAKDTTPFSEFLWANFLRRRMKRRAVSEAPSVIKIYRNRINASISGHRECF